jgi:hypothetical protein
MEIMALAESKINFQMASAKIVGLKPSFIRDCNPWLKPGAIYQII